MGVEDKGLDPKLNKRYRPENFLCSTENTPIKMTTSIYLIIQWICLILTGVPVLYIFIFSVSGIFYRRRSYARSTSFRKIAVLIPAYHEDAVIIEVAAHALAQHYPRSAYDVIVIADGLQHKTLDTLRAIPVNVIEVSFEKSTKAKAIKHALHLLPDEYDIAVVLDADNLMAVDFLQKINDCFSTGTIAVQGHRTAKNTNTDIAILDAVSEEINNHIFRKGHRAVGLSSAIIGSGMAFRYDYFKEIMMDAEAVGGFDKEIELRILRDRHRIEYIDDAFIYDEKIQDTTSLQHQRRRWISAQLHYFSKDIRPALKALWQQGNIDYFEKVLQFIQPPRILLLGAVSVLGPLFLITNQLLHTGALLNPAWTLICTSYILALILAFPEKLADKKTLRAITHLPKAMFAMTLALLKIRGANDTFIHTRHTAQITNKS
jgi:cellulose synthase/poly-beta-1,6-N-acetylglucosamine synthase-like glycosyltransferase